MKSLIKGIAIISITVMVLVGLSTKATKQRKVEEFKKEAKIDVAKEIAKHVVPFKRVDMGNRRFATGFYVKSFGKTYILTNRHVCDSNRSKLGNNIQFGDYMGKILAIDNLHDLCLVTSNRTDGLIVSEIPVKPLDKIILVGYPRGIGKVVRRGRIIENITSRIGWLDNRFVTFTQISATAYGGNSGSPVCNEDGEVVGVLFAGLRTYPNEPFIVPLGAVRFFLMRYELGI